MLSRIPNVGWEAIYLPSSEVVTYFLAFVGEGVLRMADGRMFPWARMASWTACCPVLGLRAQGSELRALVSLGFMSKVLGMGVTKG